MITGFDTTVFPKLDFRDPDRFWQMVEEIKQFFRDHESEMDVVRQKARQFRQAFAIMDPFIQEYTAKVCPYCGNVCCCNKHGYPEFADVVGILAMGGRIPSYDLSVDEGALCQFIGEKGCVLPRTERPYRCTWYFCEPLLLQIEIGPPKQYREFTLDVQYMGHARAELLQAFYELWQRHSEAGRKALGTENRS